MPKGDLKSKGTQVFSVSGQQSTGSESSATSREANTVLKATEVNVPKLLCVKFGLWYSCIWKTGCFNFFVSSLFPLKREKNNSGKAEKWKLDRSQNQKMIEIIETGMVIVPHLKNCAGPEVGLNNPCGSLPNQFLLWFCDYFKINSSFLYPIIYLVSAQEFFTKISSMVLALMISCQNKQERKSYSGREEY